MRRDMTSSLRACLAALSWGKFKEINGIKHGGDRKTKNQESQSGTFDFSDYSKFAEKHFKAPKHQSDQALAILNHSPELLEDAKEGLAEAYKTYQSRVAEDRVKRQNKLIRKSFLKNLVKKLTRFRRGFCCGKNSTTKITRRGRQGRSLR